MAKTAEYTKRAVDNYRNKFDMYQLRIPKDSGLKERMKKAYGKDMNNIILSLIENDLDRLEGKATISAPIAEKPLYQSNTKPSGVNNSLTPWQIAEEERKDAEGRKRVLEQLKMLQEAQGLSPENEPPFE